MVSSIPAALPLGKKPPVHNGEEVGWAPEPVWTLAPAGNRTLAFQPLGGRYAD
jgi:hypothetical protein